MAYNQAATRNLINVRLKVLKISKDLENKKVEHSVKNTTIIVDGVKYQGYRQLGLLEQLY